MEYKQHLNKVVQPEAQPHKLQRTEQMAATIRKSVQ